MSREYWNRRAKIMVDYQRRTSEDLANSIAKAHKQAMIDIEKEIAYYLGRLGNSLELDFQTVQQKLSRGELEHFRMSLEAYIAKGSGVLTQQTIAELERAAMLHEITRREAMMIEMKKHIDRLYKEYLDETTTFLATTYEEQFYRTLYELQQITGYETIQKFSVNKLEHIIQRPWGADGKTFSSRIWKNQDKLLQELEQAMISTAARGKSVDDVVKELAKRMDVSESAARRLIHTENSYFSSKANIDAFRTLGTAEEYELLATLDHRTSHICRSMDGKHFKYDEYEVGVTAPPFHPYCRTVIMPRFGDDIERELDGERTARNPVTGKTVKVDGTLTYQEWYKKYVSTNPEALFKEKAWKNRHGDRRQYETYRHILGKKETGRNLEDFQRIKYNKVEEWNRLQDHYFVKSRLKDGRFGSVINNEMQSPHNFETRAQDKSYLFEDIKAQDLFDRYAGTGEIVRIKGKPTHIEICVANKEIGFALFANKPTNMFKIHHSKKRTHIVPYAERG